MIKQSRRNLLRLYNNYLYSTICYIGVFIIHFNHEFVKNINTLQDMNETWFEMSNRYMEVHTGSNI